VANTVVTLQGDPDEMAFVATGVVAIGFGLWGADRRRAARNSLDQAIWWFNRNLPSDAARGDAAQAGPRPP
jgi:hypothetical protein